MGLLDKLLGRDKKPRDREHGHEHTPEYNDLQAQEPPAAPPTMPPDAPTAPEAATAPEPPARGTDTTES